MKLKSFENFDNDIFNEENWNDDNVENNKRVYNSDELNDMMSILCEIQDYWDFQIGTRKAAKGFTITSEDVGYYPILKNLIGYIVSVKSKGEHVHDGQMVRYIFSFTSPTGEKTTLYTDMCLMIGFNNDVRKMVEIK